MADVLTNFTEFIIKPTAPFAAGIILFGVVWGFFKGVESVLNEDTKLEIAVWLLGVMVGQQIEPWPNTFTRVFDRVFGSRHLTLRCLVRSFVASFAAGMLGWIVAFGHAYLNGANHFAIVTFGSGVVIPWMIVNNLIPDYISLLETRYILSAMALTRSSFLWVLFLLSDLVFTSVIATAAVTVTYGIFESLERVGWSVFNLDVGSWSYVRDNFTYLSEHPIEMMDHISHNLMQGARVGLVIMYPAFFTSIWLWLYTGSGFLLKAARRFDIGFEWFNRKFDIEKKPLSAIGLVAGALVAVIYWTVVIVSRVV